MALLRLLPRVRTARVLTLALIAVAGTPGTGWAFSITRTSAAEMSIDTGLTAGYAQYRITNSGPTSYADLWVKVTNFSGGVLGLAPNEDGIVHVGAVGAGSTTTVSALLAASGATATAQSNAVQIWDGKPGAGGSQVASQSFSTTVASTIAANANKVTSIAVSTATPALGGLVDVTVQGETGTIGSARVMSFTPAAFTSFPASSLRLVRSEVRLQQSGCPSASLNCGTLIDQLSIPTSSLPDTGNTPYQAIYTFRATNTTASSTSLSPVGYISSGTQVKHTSTSNFTSLQPIAPVVNTLTLGLQANRTAVGQSAGARTVTYTVPVSNSSSSSVQFDDVTIGLPAGATIVPGSATWGGSAIEDPAVSGATAVFAAPFTVPDGGSRTLSFQLLLSATPATYTTTAVAHSGTTAIDTTISTTDSAPGSVDVTVLAVSGPVASIVDGPPAEGTDTTATFTLTSDDEGAAPASTFECNVDSGGWAPCSSSLTLTGLSEGDHTLQVRATDSSNTTGPASATYTWTVTATPPPPPADTEPPTVTIAVPVDGATYATGQTVNATYSCADDVAIQSCTGPVTNGSPLNTSTAGTHTFTVEATDSSGDTASATASYTVQAPPSAPPASTSDTGTAPQQTTLPVPPGGSVTLLDDNGDPTTSLTIPGAGTYTLDPDTGVVTFQPDLGFAGDPPPVTYEVTDGLGQTSTGAFQPSVDAPAPPATDDAATSGTGDEVQEHTFSVPTGGTAALLDAGGNPVTSLDVPGIGTYIIDATTGRISFVPDRAFSGTAPPVTVRVTDAYGQEAEARFSVRVSRPGSDASVGGPAPPAATPNPTATRLAVATARRPVIDQTLRAKCSASGTTVARCTVRVYGRIAGRVVLVGKRSEAPGRTRVALKLSAAARALAHRPGGVRLRVVATVTGANGAQRTTHTPIRAQGRRFLVPRPVFFATASFTPNASESAYIGRLGARLRGVKSLRCVGFTDSRDSAASNERLGLARAQAVCQRLGRLLGVSTRSSASASHGERLPRATNRTATGRQLNRRTEIHVDYGR